MPNRLSSLNDIFSTAILAIAAVLSPIHDAMITCGILIVADFIMGLIGAYKNNEKISSKKMKNTLVKMCVYQLLIISAFIAEKYMLSFIPLTKITLSFVAIVEFSSLAENFQKITGLPFVKYIANYISEKLNKTEKNNGEDK